MFESVRHLARCLDHKSNIELSVIGLSDEKTEKDLAAWTPLHVETCKVTGPGAFGYSATMLQALCNSGADVVHLNGLWKYPSIAVSRWARRTNNPYVVSPRGMLEPWALQQSQLRKRIALWIFQRGNLQNAACIHATSPQEAVSIRSAGFNNPIAVIPNGVEILPLQSREQIDPNSRSRRALFLSRIHPKKGLRNLIEAWNAVVQRTEDRGQRTEDWELLIVGPDEGHHRKEVEALVQKFGLSDCVHFHDEALGEAKQRFYMDADLFILPSYSENFGLVIAEALAHAVPVITTRATPWSELQEHQCGWWVDVGVEPLTRALREATALSREQLREMGLRGREMVRENYSWDRVAEQMLEVYEWVLGRRSPPECVHFD